MRFSPLPLALLVAVALPGCSAVSAISGASEQLDIYELTVPDLDLPGTRKRNVEIVVEEPSASGALATERIMIQPGPLQAQYLPGSSWSDPAPIMLQTLMLRSIGATDTFASVGRRPLGSIGDYALLSELTDFQAETAEGTDATLVRLGVMVRLVRERGADVAASRTFTVTEPAPSAEVAAVVPAFDRAAARLLAEITAWVVANAR